MASDCPRAATYGDGIKAGLDMAMEHIRLQHPVWDHTSIPPKTLLDIIVRNLQAIKELK